MDSMYQTLYHALTAALGDDSVRILRAYANPSPPPPPEEQDVLYYHLVPEENSPLTESTYPSSFRFSAWKLILVFYGPWAMELAWRVYDRFFLDGTDHPRGILRAAHLYPVPRPQSPTMIWEEWGKQHRPRADLTIRLRYASEQIIPGTDQQVISSPPDLLMH